MSLILASNSQIRREMLGQAGVEFEVRPPAFDEDRAKQSGADGQELASLLAEGKAASIAAGPDDWVIHDFALGDQGDFSTDFSTGALCP